MDKKEINSNFLKNPIGVIGFFLVLVEAIASLVVANSNLCAYQNTILVLFIVIFPCIVLRVFYMLVTEHHEKLYSPSDYRNDDNFLQMKYKYNSMTQKNEEVAVSADIPDIDVDRINSDILGVKDLLNNVIEGQKELAKTIPNIKSTISNAEKEQLKNQMLAALPSEENLEGSYLIYVSPMHKCKHLVDKLQVKGYNAAIYNPSFAQFKPVEPYEKHQTIWLGRRVSAKVAIEVIKVAKEQYPHLKYIDLSVFAESQYQIYIGGATSTAAERNLKPLSDDDFETMYEMADIDSLHNYIKKFA